MKSIKRTMAMCAAATLVFSAMSVMPASAASGTLTFKADSATYEPGDEITVTVTYDGSNLGGFEFSVAENEYIEFAPSPSGSYPYVELPESITSIEDEADREDAESEYLAEKLAEIQASGKSIVGYVTGPDKETNLAEKGIRFIWQAGGTTNVKASGELLELTFKVKEGAPAGEYTIDLKDASFVRAKSGGDTDDVDITSVKAEFKVNAAAVSVSEVTLDKSELVFNILKGATGVTQTLTATVKPDDASDKTVTWKSSDGAVATVANGVVTAVAAGTTTITATAGGKSATAKVTVNTYELVKAKNATCTEDGNVEHYLRNDGKTFKDAEGQTAIDNVKIAKLGHDFTKKDTADKYLKSKATCVKPAEYYYSCTRCGEAGTETFTSGDVDKNNHAGDTYVKGYVAATEETEGYTGDTYCSDCNEKIKDGTKIAPLGYDYDKVDAVAATCEKDGNIEYYKRKKADGTYDGVICKLVDGNYAIITEAETVVKATGHKYGEPTYKFSDDYKTCTATMVCENDATHVITETVNTVKTVTKERTYEAGGEEVYTATFTKDPAFKAQTKTVATKKKEYSYDKVDAVAATCEKDGNIEYYKRKTEEGELDGKLFKLVDGSYVEIAQADTVIAAIGHDYEKTGVALNEDGTKIVRTYTCKNDKSHTYTTEAAASVKSEKAASCSEAGEKVYTADFSAAQDGSDVEEVTVVIDKLEHQWGEWTVTKEATEEEEGEETRTCSVCGETETRAIDKLAPEGGDDDENGEDGKGTGDNTKGSGDNAGDNTGSGDGSANGGDNTDTSNPVTGTAAALGVVAAALGSLAIFKKRK